MVRDRKTGYDSGYEGNLGFLVGFEISKQFNQFSCFPFPSRVLSDVKRVEKYVSRKVSVEA